LQDMGRDAMEMWNRESSLWSVDCSSTHKSRVTDVEILVATRMIIIWICRLRFTGICCLVSWVAATLILYDRFERIFWTKGKTNTHAILLASQNSKKQHSQLPVVIESDCGQLVAAVCDRAQDPSSYNHIIISEINYYCFLVIVSAKL
jgi:hypothetical protein